MCSSCIQLFPAFLKACKNEHVDAELKASSLGLKKEKGAECLFALLFVFFIGLSSFGRVVGICGRFNLYKCFDTTRHEHVTGLS